MYKVFTEHTKIVAVRETGNVYCNEAVEELNRKANNFRDLLTDEKFDPKKLIVLQDPQNLRNVNDFKFIQNDEESRFGTLILPYT